MKKGEKAFDAVKMMREIRDKLSEQFKEMSFEEQKQYIQQHLRGKPMKARQKASNTHNA